MDRRQRPSRAGFTLLETLIVVVVIVLLMSLLLPTINAAIRKAKEASATAEMNNIATALAGFQQKFGDYPPSRVLLCESGYSSLVAGTTFPQLSAVVGPLSPSGNDTDITVQQLAQRSLLYLNRFWSRVDFNTPSNNGVAFYDFNGNGVADPPHVLSGSECLAFFLGGVPSPTSTGTYALTGFSNNPINPFNAASNRTPPYFEFNVGRLIDQDGDGFPSYLDTINNSSSGSSQRAYAYFFSYGSSGYDPNDVNGYGHNNGFEPDENNPGLYAEWEFQVSFAPGNVTSPAPNPYTSSATMGSTVSWVNPNTFQLLCSGVDGVWGVGGTYSPNTPASVLPIVATSPPTAPNINGDTTRIGERDNLTNFSGGRLD